MIIKILGSGSKNCVTLGENAKAAAADCKVAQVAAHGVMSTPGLVVNGKVLSVGKVVRIGEIGCLL